MLSMSKPFHFKQFVIHHANAAMKVGTDGVLLGAWANVANANTILDIGTGTGLIALMMAQKSENAKITAIEIDEDAYLEAKENVKLSHWNNRVEVLLGNIQNHQLETKFDVIISNPPFYNSTFKQLELKRAMARHTQSLSYNDLLMNTCRLLNNNGLSYFIIPFEEEENFVSIANEYNLFPKEICRVKGNYETEFKRSLLCLSFENNAPKICTLVIEKLRGVYTEGYIDLVKDFYLKM
jgi:tRNA1Val (adenine37-N6)-methyltransferase